MKLFHWLVTVLTLSVVLLAACAPPEAAVPPEEAEEPAAEMAAPESKYSQSPYLDEQVASGALPPVDERLPTNPLVVTAGVISEVDDLPDLEIGEYGGVMRFAHPSPDVHADIAIMLIENVLAAPGIGITGIYGNVVESYEVNDDNTVFSFNLREGLKWSDGEPVTTADVRFVFEDVFLNETYTPGFPSKFRAAGSPDGDPVTVEILDDYAFTMSFNESYGGFLRELSIKGWQGYTDVFKPAHLLKSIHTEYGDADEIQAMMDENGLDTHQALFAAVDCLEWDLYTQRCSGFPAMWPWINVTDNDSFMRFVRNPYYFKVDAAGNQLPYIDEVVSALAADTDAVNLKVFANEVDLLREDTALLKLPLYQEAKDKGYINFTILDNHVDPTSLWLNYTYDDPVWREVVNNVEFRRALNLTINRPELIETVYYGFGSLPETVPSKHDPAQAQEILDSIGMDQRDNDGWRLGPDGNTFVLNFEVADHAPDMLPVAELLTEYFQDVGIKTNLKKIEPSYWGELFGANGLQATLLWSVQPMWRDDTWDDYTIITRVSTEWRRWVRSNGESGLEPPASVKRLVEIHQERIAAIPASEEDLALAEEIYQIHYDNLWVLPIAEKVGYVLVTDAAMRNVPIAGQAIAGNNSGEQMFYASE
ncbi:MAG: ABC transporter substrate-binding protein [Caldilineaceae bacterium SB0662_bin_9]|uniref:ABC transporter substrate-binding protein n=1 Tax=Caldilineaceae bacterium SB0662_bin_9 TaxID=2605258 RepID=A0A6B1DVI0_9CHLR|nr:ABC transporter substrate-binding protein [Caldilineaceae bacterium SB0662_bin_9]